MEEIDWCSPRSGPEDYYPELACCDFCYETAADDFMNGLDEPRQFYRILLEDLTVCIHCIPEVDEP